LPHRRSKQTRHSRRTGREEFLGVSLFRPVTLAGTAQFLQCFGPAGQFLRSLGWRQGEILNQQSKVDTVLLGLGKLTPPRRASDQLEGAFPLIRGHGPPSKSSHTHGRRSITCAFLVRRTEIHSFLNSAHSNFRCSYRAFSSRLIVSW
jgi:hypothetical protein